MSVQKVDKTTGNTTLIAGATLWADSPIGTILAYGGATAPSGWLRADGSEVSKTTYSELYSVIGDKYGTPSVNTNFKLPKVLTCGGTDFPINPTNDYYSITYKRSMIVDNELTFEISATIVTQNKACIVEVDLSSLDGLSNVTSLSCTSFSPTNIDLRLSSYDYNTSTKKLTLTIDPNYGSATKSDFSATFNGTLVGYVSDYIIKAKQVALPADLESAVEDAVEEVYGDIIPSDASSSNKLVTNDRFSGVASYVDCNTLTTAGVYSTAGANIPVSGFWFMVVVQYGYINATKYIMQIAYSVADTTKTYRRVSSDGGSTWSNWNRIITENTLTSSVTSGSTAPITSGGVFQQLRKYQCRDNSITTDINVNGSDGGRTILVILSSNSGTGDSTSSYIGMIRCGYSGNNFSITEISKSNGSSSPTDLSTALSVNSDGYIVVAPFANAPNIDAEFICND